MSDKIKELVETYEADKRNPYCLLNPTELKEKLIEDIKQLRICEVSQQRELLIAYERQHYSDLEWALAKEQCIIEVEEYLAINCG
jgi:hypothetical protein